MAIRVFAGHIWQGHIWQGHIWQGRFKAFPIQDDQHLLTVLRYVERNPVRAKTMPVRKAKNWPWGSAAPLPRGAIEGETPLKLHRGPIKRPAGWAEWVDRPQSEEELAELAKCLSRSAPYGSDTWRHRTAGKLDLESTLRPRGRPPKAEK